MHWAYTSAQRETEVRVCVAGASAASPALCYARLWSPCGYAPRSSRTADAVGAAYAVCYARMVWRGVAWCGVRVLRTHGVARRGVRVLRTHGVACCGVRVLRTHGVACCGVRVLRTRGVACVCCARVL